MDPTDMCKSGICSDDSSGGLLERIQNLRKWQDQQRRDIANQSRSSLRGSPSVESFTNTSLESPHSELLSQSLTSSINTQPVNHSVSLQSSQFIPLVVHYTEEIDVVSPSKGVAKVDSEYFQLSQNSKSSMKNIQQNDMNENSTPVSPNTDQNLILGNSTEGEFCKPPDVSSRAGHERLLLKDGTNKFEIDPVLKIQGLAHFGGMIVANNAEYERDNATTEDKFSQAKPKFAFLRKGKGTSRFGMKPIKLKSKIQESNFHDDREECKKVGGSPNAKFSGIQRIQNVTPKNYASKADNRPIRTLQLQNSSARPVAVLSETKQLKDLKDKKTKIQEKDKQIRKELEELSAFEKLEELADDSSFSSNSSTVIHLLQRGLRSASSTPIRTPPGTPSNRDDPGFRQGVSVRLTDRMDAVSRVNVQAILHENLQAILQQNVSPVVNVSQILDQLNELIRIEDLDIGALTQEEMKSLFESFTDLDVSFPMDSVSAFEKDIQFAPNNPTSTPAPFQKTSQPKQRVTFNPGGVEVCEYEVSDSDGENTLTDTLSITEDTDLVATSDLEVLSQFQENHITDFVPQKRRHASNTNSLGVITSASPDLRNHASSASRPVPELKSANAMQLQFSPPRRPQNSASHHIWSIFRKGSHENKVPRQKGTDKPASKPSEQEPLNLGPRQKGTDKPAFNLSDQKQLPIHKPADGSSTTNKVEGEQEVETYKALLMAKVCEVEKEMEIYKKDNSKLKKLQDVLHKEKYDFDQEKKNFEDHIKREKEKLREYIDAERNKLWKEKQTVLQQQQSTSITSVKEQSLEVVYLKEQLQDLRIETKKKESLHQFAVKKLNEKILMQEEELKALKVKMNGLQRLEKENLNLKHELDRKKLTKKPVVNHKQDNKTQVNAMKKPKMKTKTATINSISKSLDRVAVYDTSESTRPSSSLPSTLPRSTSTEMLHTSKPDIRRTNSYEVLRNLNNVNIQGEKEEECYWGSEEKFPGSHEIDNKVENQIVKNTKNPAKFTSRTDAHTSQGTKDLPHPSESISIDSTELCREDGTKEIIYANGNKKEIYPSGLVIMSYYNGDRKEVHEDRTAYIYGTDSTSHTTFTDGKEVLEFPNGQREVRFPDGSSEIIFSDNTRKTVHSDGTEVCTMKDGTIVRTNPDGIKVFEFISGQKEVHTPEQKRREYPDGTVKILYSDGKTETRYKTGRIRIKDQDGNLLNDTHESVF